MRSLIWLALALGLGGCGYRSVVLHAARVEVRPVTTLTPYPELAACLTRELRLDLAALTSLAAPAATHRLEVELTWAGAEVSNVASSEEGPLSLDQLVELRLRARLTTTARRVVWGPTSLRFDRLVVEGPSALASRELARAGLQRLCQEAAQRLAREVTLALGRAPLP